MTVLPKRKKWKVFVLLVCQHLYKSNKSLHSWSFTVKHSTLCGLSWSQSQKPSGEGSVTPRKLSSPSLCHMKRHTLHTEDSSRKLVGKMSILKWTTIDLQYTLVRTHCTTSPPLDLLWYCSLSCSGKTKPTMQLTNNNHGSDLSPHIHCHQTWWCCHAVKILRWRQQPQQQWYYTSHLISPVGLRYWFPTNSSHNTRSRTSPQCQSVPNIVLVFQRLSLWKKRKKYSLLNTNVMLKMCEESLKKNKSREKGSQRRQSRNWPSK